MRGILAGRLQPVVAARALTGHVAGVFHYRRGKGILIMAIDALLRGRSRNMGGRTRNARANAGLQMASITVSRHTLGGQSRSVAGLAGNARMRTFKVEAGGSVIEIRRCLRLPLCGQ